MAAGNTYTPLATQTLSSVAASVTFSSISGAYTDLVVISNIIPATTNNVSLIAALNGDASSGNYSDTYMKGSGTSATSGRRNPTNRAILSETGIGTSTSTNSTIIAYFMNYSNTTTYKTILTRSSTTSVGTEALVCLWRSTAAITSIELTQALSSNEFGIGSTFTLYGIAAA
jgi:hypothetical protein